MVFDTIVMNHDEKGRPEGGHDTSIPIHTCSSCGNSIRNDHHRNSFCHMHDQIPLNQNNSTSTSLHNSNTR